MSDNDTDDMVVLQFDTVLRGKAARALKRLTQQVNVNQSVRKTGNKIALGLLQFILERMPEEHNTIIGVTSTRRR
jgi:hypothetical protein